MYCVFIIYLLLSYRATICYMYINVFRVNSELEVIAAYVLFLSLCVVYWAVVSAKIQPTFAYHQLTSFCITFIFYQYRNFLGAEGVPHQALQTGFLGENT